MSNVQTTPTKSKAQSASQKLWLPATPSLEQGDRLIRREFERRYEAMPHLKKAELIEGVVHMSSPVSLVSHGFPHGQIMTFLGVYYAATPGVIFGDNASVLLDSANEVQPDALLRLDENSGGQSSMNEKGYVVGAPELIIEIAASSVSYDMYDKFKVYQRNGVQEYVVWQIYDKRLDWFVLKDEAYVPLRPDEDGVICSRSFPGLQLAVTALLTGDMKGVLDTLQQGLASKEHAEFSSRLQD
ncbi:MAG: Uma2 family endonuclease [Aquificales bacterium]|nr:Uma2 family endonuclease [Aquificales bacterium]